MGECVDAGGVPEVSVEVHPGGQREALFYACGANTTHGLRRSNADKRKAVVTLLQEGEWSGWSDNAIAKACGVSHTFVANCRASLAPDASKPAATRIYTDKHGQTTQMQVSRTGRKGTARAAPASVVEPSADPWARQQAAFQRAYELTVSRLEELRQALETACSIEALQAIQAEASRWCELWAEHRLRVERRLEELLTQGEAPAANVTDP